MMVQEYSVASQEPSTFWAWVLICTNVRVLMMACIFFQSFPYNMMPSRNSLCSSAVHRLEMWNGWGTSHLDQCFCRRRNELTLQCSHLKISYLSCFHCWYGFFFSSWRTESHHQIFRKRKAEVVHRRYNQPLLRSNKLDHAQLQQNEICYNLRFDSWFLSIGSRRRWRNYWIARLLPCTGDERLSRCESSLNISLLLLYGHHPIFTRTLMKLYG